MPVRWPTVSRSCVPAGDPVLVARRVLDLAPAVEHARLERHRREVPHHLRPAGAQQRDRLGHDRLSLQARRVGEELRVVAGRQIVGRPEVHDDHVRVDHRHRVGPPFPPVPALLAVGDHAAPELGAVPDLQAGDRGALQPVGGAATRAVADDQHPTDVAAQVDGRIRPLGDGAGVVARGVLGEHRRRRGGDGGHARRGRRVGSDRRVGQLFELLGDLFLHRELGRVRREHHSGDQRDRAHRPCGTPRDRPDRPGALTPQRLLDEAA